MEKKPRITLFLTEDEYESIKSAAKSKRHTVRNYAEMAVIMLALADSVIDKDQNETD